jgi:predicted house-cleaning noncanonical NTP pyrophosphatase (MazG superfamily)
MPKFSFNKLVRDNAAAELESEGIKVKYEILPKQSLIQHLKNKLLEESKEVFESESDEELAAEMADVYDVLEAICKESGIEPSEVEENRIKKHSKRGGFASGIFIHHIEIPSDSDSIEYFKNSPEKYPIIQ